MSTQPTGGLLANLSSLWCARTARTGPRRDLERADRLLLSLDAERSDGAASSSLVSPKTKRVLLEHSWRFSGNHGQPSGSPSKWSLASKRWRRASDVSEQSATAQPSTRRGCPLWPQQLLLTLPVLGLVVYISGSLACGATCSGIFALSPDSESTVFAELRRPVPLAQTHNYWYVVAFGTTMPLCMLFVWALLIVRIERIDRVDLEDLAALTRATNRVTCVEWLHAVLFEGFVALVSVALVRADFVDFNDDSHYAADVHLDEATAAPSWAAGSGGASGGVSGDDGTTSGDGTSGDGTTFDMWHPPWQPGTRWHSPWHASLALKVVLGCGVVFAVPVAFFAIRVMRVQLVAQQAGGGIGGLRGYVGAMRLRAARVLAVHGVLLGTIAVYAQTSPTFTTAMTTIAVANPCEASANATYVATYCVRSPRNYGVEYLCSDGGFDAYSSAYDACLAARDYFPVTTRVYAAFGLGLSAIVIALYP